MCEEACVAVIGALPFGISKLLAIFIEFSYVSTAGWTSLFALSVSQNVGHNAYALKQDLFK